MKNLIYIVVIYLLNLGNIKIMKTAIFKAVCILFTSTLFLSTVFGQSPNAMSYQAVIRNTSNALVTNSSIGMQISILQGSTCFISAGQGMNGKTNAYCVRAIRAF